MKRILILIIMLLGFFVKVNAETYICESKFSSVTGDKKKEITQFSRLSNNKFEIKLYEKEDSPPAIVNIRNETEKFLILSSSLDIHEDVLMNLMINKKKKTYSTYFIYPNDKMNDHETIIGECIVTN